MIVSSHALKRCKERAGFSGAAAVRMAGLAWEKGLSFDDAKGTLRNYLRGKLTLHPDSALRVYGAHIYVFGVGGLEPQLITLLDLPRNLLRQSVAAA